MSMIETNPINRNWSDFRNLVGVGIAPVKKTAVNTNSLYHASGIHIKQEAVQAYEIAKNYLKNRWFMDQESP